MTRSLSAPTSFAPDLTAIVARGDEAEQRLRAKFAPNPRDRKPAPTVVFVEDEPPTMSLRGPLIAFCIMAPIYAALGWWLA